MAKLSIADEKLIQRAVQVTGHSAEYASISQWLDPENRRSLCQVLWDFTKLDTQSRTDRRNARKLRDSLCSLGACREAVQRASQPPARKKTDKEKWLDFMKPPPLPDDYEGGGFMGLSASMVPEYWHGTMYYCPDTESDYYPSDMFSKDWVAEQEECDEVAEETGWFARLTMPGYTDSTEWSGAFETEREARKFMMEHWDTHPTTGEDIQWDYMDSQAEERIVDDVQDPDHPTRKKTSGLMSLPSWGGRR